VTYGRTEYEEKGLSAIEHVLWKLGLCRLRSIVDRAGRTYDVRQGGGMDA